MRYFQAIVKQLRYIKLECESTTEGQEGKEFEQLLGKEGGGGGGRRQPPFFDNF